MSDLPETVAVREHFVGDSRQTLSLSRVLNRTVGPILRRAPLNRSTLRHLSCADVAAAPLRPIRGSRVESVRLSGFNAEMVTGPGADPERGLIVHFHGGAFVAGGLRSHRRLVSRLSAAAGLPVLNVAYRQLPEAELEQTIQDCVTSYQWALDQLHPGGNVILSGDSAGGYLAFAVAEHAVAAKWPAPAALVALSPWVDLKCEHSRSHPNAASDPYMPVEQLAKITTWLPGDGPPLAPLLELDLSGLPPVLIQVGSTELLLSDAERLADRLAEDGTDCTLQIWANQVHVFQAFADFVPEALLAIDHIGTFIHSAVQHHQEDHHGTRI